MFISQLNKLLVMEKVTLSICAIMKDEGQYLLEWLEFHKIVGVQRFFLYENGDGSDVAEILQSYLDTGEVVLHDWPASPGQLSAYEHCLQIYSATSEWIAFIDLDEFLFPTVHNDLRTSLEEFASVAGVGVNWLMFGTSGHQTRPKGLQIENYIRRAETGFSGNQHIKSIVKPEQVIRPFDPHLFLHKGDGFTVSESYLPLSNSMTDTVSVEKLRINHYFTRSKEDMQRKMLRGRADNGHLRTWEFLESADRNEVEDRTIQRFLPMLKQAITSRSVATPKQMVAIPEIEVTCDGDLLWTGYIDYPRKDRLVYGSTLFVAGWVIGKKASAISIQLFTQAGVIAEFPIAVKRPDVLEAYKFIATTDLVGFQGLLSLDNLPNDDVVSIRALLSDCSPALLGHLRVSKKAYLSTLF